MDIIIVITDEIIVKDFRFDEVKCSRYTKFTHLRIKLDLYDKLSWKFMSVSHLLK